MGHAYRSLVGDYLTSTHPENLDYIQLTGFLEVFLLSTEYIVLYPVFLSANIIAPFRFPSLDPTYLIAACEEGFRPCCYMGDYDESAVDYR